MTGGARRFCITSLSLLLILYGVIATTSAQEFSELLRLYPIESMANRLGDEQQHSKGLASAGRRLNENELVAWEPEAKLMDFQAGFRSQFLQHLHEETLFNFVNTSGLGVGRRVLFPHFLKIPEADPIPFLDTGSRAGGRTEGAFVRLVVDSPTVDILEKMHHASVVDFVNPKGFGYFMDREHVRGFQPHHFHLMPEIERVWRVRSVELLGLVMHDEPVVYLSDNLPRMQDLAKGRIDHYQNSEQRGLVMLRSGSDTVAENSSETIHMLGAIRALRSCVACHDVERGQLLGAFSYSLEKGTPVDEDK